MRFADLVKESTSTVGTGPLTLTGSSTGFFTFASKVPVGSTVPYVLVEGTAKEVGVGTLSASTTLERTTIETSTNGGAAISLAGSATVFLGLTAGGIHRTHTESAEVATGLVASETYLRHTYSPASAPSQTIKFAHEVSFDYESTFSNSGAGHVGASIAWMTIKAGSGNPNYALAHEAKLTPESGTTLTLGSCYEGQLTGAGDVTLWNGVQGRITAFSGDVTYARGHYAQADVTSPGVITDWYGYYNDAKSGTGTVTNNFAFYNADPAAAMYSAGPICDGTLQYETPATGATITVADNISSVLINPAGTLATLTLLFPDNPINGQDLSFSTTQALSAVTYNGNGKTVLQQKTSFSADDAVVYKYFAGASLWYKRA